MLLPTNNELGLARVETETIEGEAPEMAVSSLRRVLDTISGRKNNILMKAGAITGALAVATYLAGNEAGQALANPAKSPNQAALVQPKQNELKVAISSNDIFNEDYAVADEAAQEIEDLGATAVRIFYPVNNETAWEIYHEKLCNAAATAYAHNLQLIITFNGYDGDGLGYYPTSHKEMKQFATTAASIVWTLASNRDAKHPGGCVPQQKNLIFEGINEENYRVFNRKLSNKTPDQAIVLNSLLSKVLKREAAKPEIGAKVIFGEALSAANHDAAGFLEAEGQAAQARGITNPYDFIDVHPYPAKTTENPVATMTRLFPKITRARDQYFSGSKLAYGEWGVNTLITSADKARHYDRKISSTIAVSEADQITYTQDFLDTAKQQGVMWVSLFKARDDGGGSMPSSGEIYKDGSFKTSYGKIRTAIVDAQK